MRRPSRSGLSLVVVLCANFPLIAQNLESVGKEKPISFSGGLSFNQIIYFSSGTSLRRDPYSYFASGNVNLSIYGWAIPFSFNVSNQNKSFSQPFNQYALHPSYKSVTADIGYTSMSFSPYTVNGHIFLGGGINIEPEGNWQLSALYGRFIKAVDPDSANQHVNLPAFQRMGYGFKASYHTGSNSVDLIIFHAEDDINSIHYIPDSLKITPQENLVLSLGAGKTILKHFLLKAEFSTSAITKDTRSAKTDNHHLLAKAHYLFDPRLSSAYYNALKTSFNFQKDAYQVGASYERIDPQYQTFGAYYFNNDLENITLNVSGGVLEGKMNIAASAGTQRDNLDKSKVSTMRRFVGSFNLNYIPSQHLNFSISYSTFQTFTNIRSQFVDINQLTPYDNLDTLDFTQISRNVTLSGLYSLPGSETKKQNINIYFTVQDAADTQGEQVQSTGTRFYNINTAYAMMLVPVNTSISVSFNGSLNRGSSFGTKIFGPNAVISKSFLNRKFRTTFSSAYNKTYSNGRNINAVINCRLNASIAVRNKHNINVSTVMVNRKTLSEDHHTSFTEFTGTLGYSYAFGSKGSGKRKAESGK